MAKPTSSSEGVINALLAERNQFQTWITRLESAKDTTPEAVRTKVMADYKARLDGVVAKLTEHADGIREQLEQKKGRKEELTAQETKAKETLAEAELRHTVGEYDEADWTKFRAETNKALVDVREELAKVSEEIERLAEVAKLVAGPVVIPELPKPSPAAVKPDPKPEPKAEPKPEPKEEAAPEGEAKKRESGRAEFVPSAAKAKPPADELEFLRATVGETEEPPAPASATKTVKAEKKGKGEVIPPSMTAPAPAVATPVPEAELPKPRNTNENRTLKCPECGTMNRATEWYCERCGSELAGV